MDKPPFQIHCEQVSLRLRLLSELVLELERDIESYEKKPRDLGICAKVVGKVLLADTHIEKIVAAHLPAICCEDPPVASAIYNTCEAMVNKVDAVKQNLEGVSHAGATAAWPDTLYRLLG